MKLKPKYLKSLVSKIEYNEDLLEKFDEIKNKVSPADIERLVTDDFIDKSIFFVQASFQFIPMRGLERSLHLAHFLKNDGLHQLLISSCGASFLLGQPVC